MVTPEIIDGRIRLVEEHVQAENAHDLERIMTTFGEQARYEDQPWDEHHQVLAEYKRTTCGCFRHCLICISPSSADT